MKLSFRSLVIALPLAAILFTGAAMAGVSAWRSSILAGKVEADLTAAVNRQIDSTVAGLYNVVSTQGESINEKVDADLRVATDQLNAQGGFRLGAARVAWEAVNQATGAATPVTLPRAQVGSTWLGKETSQAAHVPVVDDTKALVGDTATIFQRMNEAGDMLRVATNVSGPDGLRVIGTYISATASDGSANPVLASVLAGKTYSGTANVVGDWYVTRYQPLKDGSGRVIGMLYVGVKQQSVKTLKETILAAQVGAHGQVQVLGTTGVNRGVVRVARDEALVGESLADQKDGAGKRYLNEALYKSATLGAGESATVSFVKEDGRPASLRVAYYAPWDWTLAVETVDSDFAAPMRRLHDSRTQMILFMLLAAVVTAVAGAAFAWRVGARITRPLEHLRDRMAEIADGEGDLTQRVSSDGPGEPREVAQLGDAFNRFVAKVARTVQEVTVSGQRIAQEAARIAGLTHELESAATHSSHQSRAAREATDSVGQSVGAAAAGTEQMSASIREIAQSAARAAKEGSQATRLAEETELAVSTLGSSSVEIGNVIKTITSIAEQTNLLALNATIESARAGEAGKGFAVVAGEVKELARETALATEDISRRIVSIQDDSSHAVQAISLIASAVREINDGQSAIAATVEEQSAVTSEVARGVAEASYNVEDVRGAMAGIDEATQQSAEAIRTARESADELAELSEELNRQLGVFIV